MKCPNCDNKSYPVMPIKKMTTENGRRYKWWRCEQCSTYILIPVGEAV